MTRGRVALPGPPPVSSCGCAKTCSDVIIVITAAKKIDGEIIGRMMLQVTRQPEAPSIAAASSTESGSCSSAAEKISML